MNRQQLELAQTEILNKHGAFFAFSNSQFNEQKQDGITYTDMMGGLIAPKGSELNIINDMNAIHKKFTDSEVKLKGKKKLIHEQLANHEAQISYSIDDTVDYLEPYGITREEVQAEWSAYIEYCRENDLF